MAYPNPWTVPQLLIKCGTFTYCMKGNLFNHVMFKGNTGRQKSFKISRIIKCGMRLQHSGQDITLTVVKENKKTKNKNTKNKTDISVYLPVRRQNYDQLLLRQF